MAINFSQLPTENPFSLPPARIYKARVTKAEMKTGPSGQYLSLTYALSDGKGKRYGNVFDILSESPHQAVLYKIGRFVSALKLNLQGNCELKDLAKIVTNREMCVDIVHQPDRRDATQTRAQIKLFGSECYWPIEQYAELMELYGYDDEETATTEGAALSDADVPFEFDAADGVPPAAPVPTTGENEY